MQRVTTRPMIERPSRTLKRVLFTLAVAGTVLIAWNAADATAALPILPPRPSEQGSPLLPGGALERLAWDKQYGRPHDLAVRRIWERAAKTEFVLLAAAVCVWLVLPRASAAAKT